MPVDQATYRGYDGLRAPNKRIARTIAGTMIRKMRRGTTNRIRDGSYFFESSIYTLIGVASVRIQQSNIDLELRTVRYQRVRVTFVKELLYNICPTVPSGHSDILDRNPSFV